MMSRKPRPAPNRNGRGFASSCASPPSALTPAVTRRTHRGRHMPPGSTARVGCRSSGARKGSRFRPLPQGTGGWKRALLGVSPRRTPLCSSGNRRLVSREMGGRGMAAPSSRCEQVGGDAVRPARAWGGAARARLAGTAPEEQRPPAERRQGCCVYPRCPAVALVTMGQPRVPALAQAASWVFVPLSMARRGRPSKRTARPGRFLHSGACRGAGRRSRF